MDKHAGRAEILAKNARRLLARRYRRQFDGALSVWSGDFGRARAWFVVALRQYSIAVWFLCPRALKHSGHYLLGYDPDGVLIARFWAVSLRPLRNPVSFAWNDVAFGRAEDDLQQLFIGGHEYVADVDEAANLTAHRDRYGGRGSES